MDKKFKVKLNWVPKNPGTQELTVTADNSVEAQEQAASVARSIFPELTEGHWSITDVDSPTSTAIQGDFNGDMYGTEFAQPYIASNSWEGYSSPTYGLANGLVSVDTHDDSNSGSSNMDYTSYASSKLNNSLKTSEDISSQKQYKSYVELRQASSVEAEDEDDVNNQDETAYTPYSQHSESEAYTPYSSVAQPASSSEEEGVTASQAAGYTAYFPGSSAPSGSGPSGTKAYYAELGNGYSPYRAFRIPVAKGTKIII